MKTPSSQPRQGGASLLRATIVALVLAALTTALAVVSRDGATAAAASGPTELTETVSIAEAVDRSCFARPLAAAPGSASLDFDPALGDASYAIVDARLEGPAGSDWDIAVFDAGGEVVAAGASSGPSEFASGYATAGGALVVQACRRSGGGTEATISLTSTPVDAEQVPRTSLALVETPTRDDKRLLTSLGLDLTEHGGEDHLAVVLHGAEDRAVLDKVGLEYTVEVGDLDRQSARQRAAEERYAARTTRSSLPSGRDTYRRLFDYDDELKALADDHPNLVRLFTLPHETYEGREVAGIEITTDVDLLRDGKPIFLQMGLHHAREWPSGEHAMEWAYELIEGYRDGDPRVRRLVEKTRTIIVPVVNPDGFNASREAGEALGHGNGQDGTFLTNFPTAPNEYRRKNCRLADDSEAGDCNQPAVGIQSFGVDPNRNYGGFWGGAGASDIQIDEDYRGPGPFSEPETRNIRDLLSARQVTTLITNHTFSNLVIRPPSLASDPVAPDEPIYKALGDAMAAENGYISQYSYELYDTSGGTEDWSYYATGGLGYTFEIGCNHIPDPLDERCSGNFHPTYPHVVAEYEGTSTDAQAIGGDGNREAYFLAHENAADASKHSVLAGTAPPGAVLKIEKTFETPTRNEAQPSFEDHLESELKVPDSGKFDWHINPSTRPLVAIARGREALGSPSDPVAPTPPGGTIAGTEPCASFDTDDPACWNDHAFTIPGGAGIDNDSATVELRWTNPGNDWDLKVFRDVDNDGTSEAETDADEVGESGNSPPGTSESTTFVRPETADGRLEPGQYVARVINYAVVSPDPYSLEVTFAGPEPFEPPRTETWSFTCSFVGEARVTREILIGRGERQALDLAGCGKKAGGRDVKCSGRNATLVGTKGPETIVGTKRSDVIAGLAGNDKIRGRGGKDVICGRGGKDKLKGGAGKDRINAGGKRDRLSGGPANDRLQGGRGKDRCFGGPGRDRELSC